MFRRERALWAISPTQAKGTQEHLFPLRFGWQPRFLWQTHTVFSNGNRFRLSCFHVIMLFCSNGFCRPTVSPLRAPTFRLRWPHGYPTVTRSGCAEDCLELPALHACTLMHPSTFIELYWCQPCSLHAVTLVKSDLAFLTQATANIPNCLLLFLAAAFVCSREAAPCTTEMGTAAQ